MVRLLPWAWQLTLFFVAMKSFFRPSLLLVLLTLSCGAQAQQKLKYPKAPAAGEVYDQVEQPALPAGGTEAFARYLAEHQQYPTSALQRGVEGTVTVSFVVEKTGSLSNVAVEPALDPELDAEAMRLIKASPRWAPARHRGGVVRQRVTIPITFEIPKGPDGSAPTAGPVADQAGPQVVTPDEPARPVGGTDSFFAWIQENQRYPALARQRKIQGRVIVEFMVQKDGLLSEAKVVKRIGSGCDEEALRLIKSAPKWSPARYKGQPMRQKMVLPVVFQL